MFPKTSYFTFALACIALCSCEQFRLPGDDGKVHVEAVKLDVADSTVLSLGESLLIGFKITPENAYDKSFVWVNSNPDVVSLDEEAGKITALKPGRSVVGIECADRKKRGVVSIFVDEGFIHVSSVSLNVSDEQTMIIEDKMQLKVTIQPRNADDKTFDWTNTDPEVISIDEQTGVITAAGIGSSVVGVVTHDREKVAKVFISVLPPRITSIQITDAGGAALDSYGFSSIHDPDLQLYAKILPDDGYTRTLDWSSSNNACCSVDRNGKVRIVGGGSTVITAMAKDGTGKEGHCTVTVPGTAVKDRNYDIEGGINADGYYKLIYEPVEITVPVFDQNKQKVGTETQIWLDRNLGAKQRAENLWDPLAAGSLFQWGRYSDGHEKVIWTITSNHLAFERAAEAVECSESERPALRALPGTDKFLLYSGDWSADADNLGWGGLQYSASDNNYATQYEKLKSHAPLTDESQVNNPCPYGYRVPTLMELEQMSLGIAGLTTINISSSPTSEQTMRQLGAEPMYLVTAGYRHCSTGSASSYGTIDRYDTGYYMLWSCHGSSVANAYRWQAYMKDTIIKTAGVQRANGLPVRCIKD